MGPKTNQQGHILCIFTLFLQTLYETRNGKGGRQEEVSSCLSLPHVHVSHMTWFSSNRSYDTC